MNIAFQPTQCYQEMRYGTWLFWAKWRVDYGLGSDSANQSVWRVSLGLVLRPLLLCTVLCYVVLLVVSFCPLPATSSLQSRADWPVPYPAHDQSSSAQPTGDRLRSRAVWLGGESCQTLCQCSVWCLSYVLFLTLVRSFVFVLPCFVYSWVHFSLHSV